MANTLLLIALIIFAAKLSGWISVRLGQPAVLGELVVGLLLGPTVFDVMSWPLFAQDPIHATIKVLAEVGVILLMFIAGLEVNLADMRHAGRAAAWTGTLGVFVPWAMGAAFALALGFPLDRSLFIGIILTATSVSISAQTLIELGLLRSREGFILLGAAVFDDVLVIFLLSIFLAIAGGSPADPPANLALIVLRMVAFLVAATLVGLLLLRPLVRWIERLPVSAGVLSGVIVTTLMYAWAAEALGGIAAITGAFVAGVFFGRTHARETIETGMHALTYGFFVPIFFVSIGLDANGRALGLDTLGFVVGLCLVAIASKIIGSGLGARMGKTTWRQALRIGIGMVSRGEVGLIVAAIGLRDGLVSDVVYSATVLMILVTTLVTPALLRAAFGPAPSPTEVV